MSLHPSACQAGESIHNGGTQHPEGVSAVGGVRAGTICLCKTKISGSDKAFRKEKFINTPGEQRKHYESYLNLVKGPRGATGDCRN